MRSIWTGVIVSSVFLLAACASTDDNLQRETARSIGGNVSPDSVSVSDVDPRLAVEADRDLGHAGNGAHEVGQVREAQVVPGVDAQLELMGLAGRLGISLETLLELPAPDSKARENGSV